MLGSDPEVIMRRELFISIAISAIRTIRDYAYLAAVVRSAQNRIIGPRAHTLPADLWHYS